MATNKPTATPFEREQARKARAAERQLARGARERALSNAERRIACPQDGCEAKPGEKCGSVLAGKWQDSAWPHVVRKRAYGRLIRIDTVEQVLDRHEELTISNVRDIATEIVDALIKLNQASIDARQVE